MNRVRIIDPESRYAVGQYGQNHTITCVHNCDTVPAKDMATGDTQYLEVHELTPPAQEQPPMQGAAQDLALITDEDWQIAYKRFNCIRPLLESSRKKVEEVDIQARIAGVHRTTIYRWIKAYQITGLISSLVPKHLSGGRGKSRLPERTEALVNVTIEDFYLHNQKRSVINTFEEVKRRCQTANLVPPHYNTVRNRIILLSERVNR